MNFDSPAANLAIGIGDMGLDLSMVMARGEDDQKTKVEQILNILKVSKGRLSKEGLERLARRFGIHFLWEQLDKDKLEKSIVFAGNLLALEVTFSHDMVVDRVSLDIMNSNDSVTKYKDEAAKILHKDLEYAPGESALTKMLDKFADNLERLAAFEKLSVIPMLNCFEAIAGIHDSLKRIHDWEVARLKQQAGVGEDQDGLSKSVMCTKSGRPVMHSRQRVGLSLEYWQEKRLISSTPSIANPEPKTWAMVLECENAPELPFANPPQQPYTRVRVSDAWISQSIIKSDPSPEDLFMGTPVQTDILDWLEPDLTLVPAADDSKGDTATSGMPLDPSGQEKLPDIMFTAKFEPPLAIPNYVMDHIYKTISAPMYLYPFVPSTTIDALLVPLAAEENNTFSPSRQIQRQRTVPVMDQGGARTSRLHRSTLFVQKLDAAFPLCSLPFSHPQQLIKILPYLRQHAFLATLIEKSFGSKTEKISAKTSERGVRKITNKRDDFMDFMQETEKDPQDTNILNVDVTLVTDVPARVEPPFPGPKIEIIFPFRNRSANLTIEIGLNGAVSVLHENVLPAKDHDEMEGLGGEGAKKTLTKEDLGRVLEVCEDFNLFAEYVRRRLG